VITILCSGSRGDIQPYIALAQALQEFGQEVRIATGTSFESFVTGYGISFIPLSADPATLQNLNPELMRTAQGSDNPIKMLLTFRKMKSFADKAAASMTEECFHACEASELVIYHPGCVAGYFAARQMGIPAVLASPFPMHRTQKWASVVAYGRYPLLPKSLSYSLLQGMLWSVSKKAIADYLKETAGSVPRNFRCPFEHTSARYPAVISCSNAVFQRPDDWDKHISQFGYWFLHDEKAYQPPKELVDFIAAGEKPVYIGFGSMLNQEESISIAGLAAEALQAVGKRGILCGFSGVGNLPDSIMTIPGVSHSWLFDKVSAICHHGGAGTTAAGFAAGVPSIIVPFSNDQFAWAYRAYELGVAPKPLSKKHLSASRLAEAICFTDHDDVRQRAAALGAAIRAENGAKDAALAILSTLDDIDAD
jgi:sterol 3beta-glucosyltransferase